eukprot:scaffold128259_cov22-Tisochrysis_lutea.AAC.4
MSINLPTITLSNRLALQSRPASQCSALYNLLCVASLTLKSKPARPGQVQPLYTTPKQDLRTAASVTTSPQKIPSSLLMQSRPARPEQVLFWSGSLYHEPVYVISPPYTLIMTPNRLGSGSRAGQQGQ